MVQDAAALVAVDPADHHGAVLTAGHLGHVLNYRQLNSGGQVIVGAAATTAPQALDCADVLAQPPTLPPGIDPSLVDGLRAQCKEIERQREQRLPEMYSSFALPGSIPGAIGTVLIAVLASSTVGVEYGWGTMRTTLVSGTGRWQYLTGKFAVLFLFVFAALLVIVIGAAISSTIATTVIAPPAGYVPADWIESLEAIGRGWYGLVPMMALVILLTVLTSSTATGMAIGIGYTIAEPLIVALLGQLSERLTGISDYLLAANISGWNGSQGFGATGGGVGEVHHFIVLLLYTVVFIAGALWLLESRDVTKATGT